MMEHWYVMVPVMVAQQFELTGRLDHSDRPDGAIPLRKRMVDAYERAYRRAREPLEPETHVMLRLTWTTESWTRLLHTGVVYEYRPGPRTNPYKGWNLFRHDAHILRQDLADVAVVNWDV